MHCLLDTSIITPNIDVLRFSVESRMVRRKDDIQEWRKVIMKFIAQTVIIPLSNGDSGTEKVDDPSDTGYCR